MLVGTIAVAIVFGLIFAIAAFSAIGSMDGFIDGGGSTIGLVFVALAYIAALLVSGGLSLVMITQPIIRHVVEETSIADDTGLSAIRQREADLGADAEGFADALDVGGAI